MMLNTYWNQMISHPNAIEMTTNLIMMNPIILLPTGLPSEDYMPFIDYFYRRKMEQFIHNQQKCAQQQRRSQNQATQSSDKQRNNFNTLNRNQSQTCSSSKYFSNSEDDFPDDVFDPNLGIKLSNYIFRSMGMHEEAINQDTANEHKIPSNTQKKGPQNNISDSDNNYNRKSTKPIPVKKQQQISEQSYDNDNCSKSKPKKQKCSFGFCEKPVMDGFIYCSEHKCQVNDCKNKKSSCTGGFKPFCDLHKCHHTTCKNQALKGCKYCLQCKCHNNTCKEEKLTSSPYCYRHHCDIVNCQNERVNANGCHFCIEHKCLKCNSKKTNSSKGNYCSKHTCKKAGCYELAVTNGYYFNHLW